MHPRDRPEELGRRAAELERRYLSMPLVYELVRGIARNAYRANIAARNTPPSDRSPDEWDEAEERFINGYVTAYYAAWRSEPPRRHWWRFH